MSNTLKFGNGEWYGKEGTILAYNDENNNYKPLPFTFERDSVATRVNKQGLIETVGADQPRIDYLNDSNGALLLEPSRTNSLPHSNNYDEWTKAGLTVTSGQIGVGGSLDAWKLQKNASAGYVGRTGFYYDGVSTFSIFAKAGSVDWIRVTSQSGNFRFNVNLSNGEVGVTGSLVTSTSVQYYGNGWYRCTATGDSLANGFYIKPAETDDNPSGVDGSIFIQNAQVETNSSYATSYIPTQGSAVTRLAESCSQTVPDGVIGQTEGTVFMDFKPQTLDGASRYLSIENSNSISNGWMGVFASLLSGTIRFRFYGDGWDFDTSLIIEKGTRYKIAFSYKNGVQTSIYINGNLLNNITASLSGKSYQKIRLSEGAIGGRGDADFNDIKLYDTIKTDQELAALTQV
jgi:hypothetical protein